jgi:hypothetical protein
MNVYDMCLKLRCEFLKSYIQTTVNGQQISPLAYYSCTQNTKNTRVRMYMQHPPSFCVRKEEMNEIIMWNVLKDE